jgi:1-acyl-sn-glycerol-3-phosphate acyltransferase
MTVVLLRFKVRGMDNIPLRGPVILAVNHISFFDPPLVANGQLRVVHYFAKSELFKNPIFRILIKSFGAFPVKRGVGDISAIKTVLKLMKKDRVVLIFPEGTRSKDGTLGRGQEGPGMLALRSGATIIPTYIKNSDKFIIKNKSFELPKIEVRYGKPLNMEKYSRREMNRELYQEVADDIMERIKYLRDRWK